MSDFFVAGDEYLQKNLDLKFIPQVNFGLIGLAPVQKIEEKVLEDYIKLCVDNGAKPVCVVLPVSATVKKNYNANDLKLFRETINKVVKKYKAEFIDLFDDKPADAAATAALLSARLYFANVVSLKDILNMPAEFFKVLSKYFPKDCKKLIQHVFCKLACDDFNRLSKTLPREILLDLMANVFANMTYNHLANLSDMLSKDDYNDLAARVFKISAEKIRRKDKIKVGFYFAYSSFYFGDDLYNLFANDERFEPTLFINTKSGNAAINSERFQDAERFKKNGINIFDLNDKALKIPAQDVLFCLTPYQGAVPVPFRLVNLKLTTLMVNIPYTFSVCAERGHVLSSHFVRSLWKMFFPSTMLLKLAKKVSKVGMVRGLYSGYPKMDAFFRKDAEFKFDWKMIRPDAKKIIWAPHHSITNKGPVLATFQWNYKFLYEFAKNHPETSWIVKTHPALPLKVVSNKIFPSIAAYEEYLQAWDDLPNAQVYMGAYYQAIFATSDGMIQDCASFVAEYQYVDKPMIYLTRDTQKFNELGAAILNASYLVDGKDLEGIAATIQRVIIDGDDYKASERKEVFDKYLNYPKSNGMLASEFIFKNIADELICLT